MHADRTDTERRVRTRRAVGLLVMSAVAPGSAQYAAGNRAVGRAALRIWAGLWLLALLLALGLLILRGPTLTLLLNGGVLAALRIAAWMFFAGWALLLIDAWRLARPLGLVRAARLTLTICAVVLVTLAGFATSVAASALTAAGNVSLVLGGGGDSEKKDGRYNILLLGVDASASREGIRPDSINVASVDAETGRTVIFGLPRNLEGAPFPTESPLHELYPDGFKCAQSECMLNGIYTLATENADLYPGQDAGLVAMREAASEILGLDINYHAMVDMAGFEALIDAMGGITVNIGRDIPIGGGSSPISGYIEAGEGIELDGYHALWLARSRADSNDYERMVRQKCVISAMAKQLDPSIVATRFLQLSEAGKDIVTTDVGVGHVSELVELALHAKSLDLVSVDFTPPLIDTESPDLALIRTTVVESIERSEAFDDEAAGGAESPESEPLPAESTSETPRDEEAAPTANPEPTGADEEPVAPEIVEVPVCSVG